MRGVRRSLGGVVAAAVVAGGCGAGSVQTIDEFERTSGVAAPVQPDPEAVRRIEEATTPPTFPRISEVVGGGTGSTPRDAPVPEEAPIGFGDGAEVVGTALAGVGDGALLVEAVLYDGYGIVTSYRADSGDFDRVVVRRGRSEVPSALPDTTVTDAGSSAFGPTDVDWSIIPGLVERTPGDLGVEGGRVSHVIVEKNLPFTPDLVIRVYVSSERSGGRIDYFADGRPMRSFKD